MKSRGEVSPHYRRHGALGCALFMFDFFRLLLRFLCEYAVLVKTLIGSAVMVPKYNSLGKVGS